MAEGGANTDIQKSDPDTWSKDEIFAFMAEITGSALKLMEDTDFMDGLRDQCMETTDDWNDDKFKAKYGRKLPTFKVPSIAESFTMALHAYKYWLTGKSELDNDKAFFIKAAALMRSPLSNEPSEFMFPWFFSSSANNLLMCVKNLEPISLEDLSEEVRKAVPIGSEISRFLSNLHSLTDDDLKQRMFINFVSYSALIMLRCYSKNEENVLAAFNKTSAQQFCDLFGYDKSTIVHLYPPKSDLLKNFNDRKKKLRFPQHMLTASLKVLLEEQGSMRTARSKVVETTHLTDLYYHELQTIPLLYEAAQELSLKPKELNAHLQSMGNFKLSTKRIEEYMTKEHLNKKYVTVPFSRFYDEVSHSTLTVKENTMYCYLLAIILENKNSGVFNSVDFKSLTQTQKDEVKTVHQGLMESLNKSEKSTRFVQSQNMGPLNISRELYG